MSLIDGDRDDFGPDFIPHHASGAPSGSKIPVISARSRVSDGDRVDLRPDFNPQYAFEAPAGS